MTPEAYERALTESGKLKLRAMSRLALGDGMSRFEAAVLFHEAVRAEQRALALLPAADPSTRLRFAVERCGCLLDGLDPLAASRVWGDVLMASEGVPSASAMRARIDSKYAREEQAFGALLRQQHIVVAEGAFIPGVSMPRGKVRKALATLLKAYPGVADLWFAQCRELEREGRFAEAWQAIVRARQLAPDEPTFEAAGFWPMRWRRANR